SEVGRGLGTGNSFCSLGGGSSWLTSCAPCSDFSSASGENRLERCASTKKRGLTESREALASTDAWHQGTIRAPRPALLAGTAPPLPRKSDERPQCHNACEYGSGWNDQAMVLPSRSPGTIRCSADLLHAASTDV